MPFRRAAPVPSATKHAGWKVHARMDRRRYAALIPYRNGSDSPRTATANNMQMHSHRKGRLTEILAVFHVLFRRAMARITPSRIASCKPGSREEYHSALDRRSPREPHRSPGYRSDPEHADPDTVRRSGAADGLRSLAMPQGIDGPAPLAGESMWPVTFGVPPGRAGDRPGGRATTHAAHRAVRALGCPRRRRMVVI